MSKSRPQVLDSHESGPVIGAFCGLLTEKKDFQIRLHLTVFHALITFESFISEWIAVGGSVHQYNSLKVNKTHQYYENQLRN